MKIVVSPAKTLELEKKVPTDRGTQPKFLEDAEKLNSKLERKSKKEIAKLMSISEKLTALNYQRYKDFELPFDKKNSRPAIYTFAGDVYDGLDAYSLELDKLDRLQDTLRILSGMYGILRPLDLMQAYRLEMGTDLKSGRKENLYEFWGDRLTKSLNDEMADDEIFINLASNEYFNAINTKKLKVPIVKPVFKDYKNGDLKVISFYAKKARGLMVRYVIDKNITDLDGLKGFDYEDYGYSEKHSDPDKNEFVFIR